MTNLTFVKGDREPDGLDPVSQAILDVGSGTSIFDPVLCEIAYRWFCPPNGVVLDPFAGGSVRGIVASRLGRRYIGVELRTEQVAANVAQLSLAGDPAPEWRQGDSRDIARIAGDVEADLVFSCPPYWNLEEYSDDPADLSAMGRFDVILLRGVLRGMDAALRARVVGALVALLPPDGVLALDPEDDVSAFDHLLAAAPGECGIYLRDPSARAAAA